MLAFGLTFTVLCLLIYGIGHFVVVLGDHLAQQPRVANFIKWFSGSILIGLGV